jgi:hypothetical protein
VRRLQIVTGVLLVMYLMSGARRVEGSVEPGTVIPPADRVLWLLPPACELPLSGDGRLSLEIGLTPALREIGGDSEDALAARAGVFMYPQGRMRGLALYAGVGESGPEGGLWYVWRRDRGMLGFFDSFRVGIGIVSSTDPHWALPSQLGIGAALGYAF